MHLFGETRTLIFEATTRRGRYCYPSSAYKTSRLLLPDSGVQISDVKTNHVANAKQTYLALVNQPRSKLPTNTKCCTIQSVLFGARDATGRPQQAVHTASETQHITAEQHVESSPKVDAMLHRVPETTSQSESNKHTECWTRFSYNFTDLLSPYTAPYVRTGCRILESFRRASPTTPALRRAWIRTSVRRSSVSRMTSTIWHWR